MRASLILSMLFIASTPVSNVARAQSDKVNPTLTIRGSEQEVAFTRSQLLARPDIQTITVTDDPAYPGKSMIYKAVPAAALFKDVRLADDAVIQFKCLDGFSAPISKERILSNAEAKSVAFVAIEGPEAPWPAMKPNGPSAGPFYLIWVHPEASAISREEWPFQLAAFEVKGALTQVYPNIAPDMKLKAESAVRLGFGVFTRNCFACHTMNKEGATDVGPDLNVPMSPTEYFTKRTLRKLIRDPQSVRHFPKGRMVGFPPTVLSDKDLDHLVAYFAHMAKRRPSPSR